MKDCCKTERETEQKKSGLKKWLNYILYAFIAVVIIAIVVMQISGK